MRIQYMGHKRVSREEEVEGGNCLRDIFFLGLRYSYNASIFLNCMFIQFW